MRLFSTLGVMRALEEVLNPGVTVAWGPTKALMQRIAAGEEADAAILTAEAIDVLIAQGRMARRLDLAQSGVGLAVRAGAALPDISTPDALRSVLLGAGSIATSAAGASGAVFAAAVASLGIGAEVAAKSVVIPLGLTGEMVLRGEAEMAVQQVSELMAVPGLALIGPLPPPLQVMVTFSAGDFLGGQEMAAMLARHFTPELLARHGLETADTLS